MARPGRSVEKVPAKNVPYVVVKPSCAISSTAANRIVVRLYT